MFEFLDGLGGAELHRTIEVRSGFCKKYGRTSIVLELSLKF